VVRPFVRDGKSDVASREGVALILRNVGQVLGTQCSNEAGTLVGEVPWRPRFGSLLYALRHRNLDQTTQELAKVFVAEALARWEPRAQLRAVVLSETSSVSGGNIDTLVMALSLDIRDRDSAVIEQDVKLSLSIQK
jgi:phage baseplate assembly protein W